MWNHTLDSNSIMVCKLRFTLDSSSHLLTLSCQNNCSEHTPCYIMEMVLRSKSIHERGSSSYLTLKLGWGLVGPDAGHVELLGHRIGQHPLQPLKSGLALGCQMRQTLLIGAERGHITLALLCRVEVNRLGEELILHLLIKSRLASPHTNLNLYHSYN